MLSINVASPMTLYQETLTLLERLATLRCSNEDDYSLKLILGQTEVIGIQFCKIL